MPPAAHGVILLVEDDQPLRQLYRLALEVRGFIVDIAGDGLSALDRVLESPPPQLIVLDLGLPRVSGLEVARELVAHAETRDIPIVVVTGTTESFDPAPFAAVLRKPVGPDELVFEVEQTLVRGQRRKKGGGKRSHKRR